MVIKNNVKNRAFFLIGIVSLLLIGLLVFVATKGKSLFDNYINVLTIVIGVLFAILLVVSVILLVWEKKDKFILRYKVIIF